MSITKKDIEHVARLARLALSAEEQEKLTRDLESILDYVAKLNELNTDKVALVSKARGPRSQNLREDLAEDSGIQEAILNAAPKRRQRFFEVKGVFEE